MGLSETALSMATSAHGRLEAGKGIVTQIADTKDPLPCIIIDVPLSLV
jgi:hypothetical protein